MKRFHATPSGPVPFTPEEEAARDAEEAAEDAARQAQADADKARAEAQAVEQAELEPIRAVLAADQDLDRARLRRALRYLFKAADGA